MINIWQILPWRCRNCGARFGLCNRSNIYRADSGRCCICEVFVGPAATIRGGGREMSEPRTGNGGVPAVSPLSYAFDDYLGRILSITLVFDQTTRVITGITVFRDAACLWRHVLIGLGPDGTPDSSPRAYTVPAGTTQVPVSALNAQGVDTIEEFLAYQLTAGL